jgi:hypothetical protein
MWIMTKDGWKPLEVRNCVKAVRQEYPDGPYRGSLPSTECVGFIARLRSRAERTAARANAQRGEDGREEPIEATSEDLDARAALTGSRIAN